MTSTADKCTAQFVEGVWLHVGPCSVHDPKVLIVTSSMADEEVARMVRISGPVVGRLQEETPIYDALCAERGIYPAGNAARHGVSPAEVL